MKGGKQSKVGLRARCRARICRIGFRVILNKSQRVLEENKEQALKSKKLSIVVWRRCGGGDLAEYKLTMQGQEGLGSI